MLVLISAYKNSHICAQHRLHTNVMQLSTFGSLHETICRVYASTTADRPTVYVDIQEKDSVQLIYTLVISDDSK